MFQNVKEKTQADKLKNHHVMILNDDMNKDIIIKLIRSLFFLLTETFKA